MKLILHIGMGKTGTSSIQTVLRSNAAALAGQKAHYLGMWFDAIDPAYRGHAGLLDFMALDDAAKLKAAGLFLSHLRQQAKATGADTFILSNEGIFGHVHSITPFLRALQPDVDLSVIVYIRNPSEWLPSAFTQWGLFHKEQTGPLQPFHERARVLITQYAAIPVWIENFGDQLVARRHAISVDVVADFSEVTGLYLTATKARLQERPEPSEILLRAAFNNRFASQVFPERFNHLVMAPRQNIVPLQTLAALCFAYDGLADLVQSHRELFETIGNALGPDFDFTDVSERIRPAPDPTDLQNRLIDHLVEITFQQGERIAKLEKQVQDLSAGQ